MLPVLAEPRPILITTARGVRIAEGLAEQNGIVDRLEPIEVGQFIATNVHELGLFRSSEVAANLIAIFERYNAIIEQCESNPSLKVAMGGRGD